MPELVDLAEELGVGRLFVTVPGDDLATVDRVLEEGFGLSADLVVVPVRDAATLRDALDHYAPTWATVVSVEPEGLTPAVWSQVDEDLAAAFTVAPNVFDSGEPALDALRQLYADDEALVELELPEHAVVVLVATER